MIRINMLCDAYDPLKRHGQFANIKGKRGRPSDTTERILNVVTGLVVLYITFAAVKYFFG